jgi:D-tyrosyl-tRNA(Tyr) deacylase
MRIVIQRVTQASVSVADQVVGSIGPGLLVLVAVQVSDTSSDVGYLVAKTLGLRIFDDENGKMNRSIMDTGGSLLIVSQFTPYADYRKGMRPSYDRAARPDHARALYEQFVAELRGRGVHVETGVFQASMQVSLTNDGPVTLLVDSPSRQNESLLR